MAANITKQHIIVTGGAGFIGSHLVRELVRLGNHVTIIDIKLPVKSLFTLEKLRKKAVYIRADVRNKKKIFSIVKKTKPNYIFHLAAEAIVEDALAHPDTTLETNISGTVNILEAARIVGGVRAILVTSSDKAYGKKSTKYVETDALRGDHPYEVSKSAADLISLTYAKTYNMPVIVTRFGNVYGEGDLNFSRIIPGIMESIVRKKKLILRSNGKYVRDYLYVGDVVSGAITLASRIQKTKGEAYNFGSKETLSVISLIGTIQKILGIQIPYSIQNTATNEIPSQSLNYAKIKKTISWSQKHNLKATIPGIYAFYKKIL